MELEKEVGKLIIESIRSIRKGSVFWQLERILLSYDCVDGLPSALFMQQFCALFCSLEMIRQLVNWFGVIMHLEMQILRLGMC